MSLGRDLAATRSLRPSFRLLLSIPPVLISLLAACGGGDLVLPGGDGTAIQVVDGNGQQGSVGEPLAAPVVVKVTGADSLPVEGATVEFAPTSAGDGAAVTPTSARTSAAGLAEVRVVLGDKVGLQTWEAKVVAEGDTPPKTTFMAVAVPEDNRLPLADFGWSCEGLTCRFTDASSDGDGSLAAWAWRFGDGSTSAEREPTHEYAAGGTYTVRLTVTDDLGGTDELADDVRVTAPSTPPSNEAPRADFDLDCDDLRCTFTDRSEDDDGSIESWQWDFGDGATSTQRSPSHSYGSAGRYDVVLRVTDDDGAADSRTRTAEPEAPAPPPPPPPPPPTPNDPPEAEFEVDCQDLRCTFVDRSTDGDGTVTGWQWDFGDGATSTERNPSHVYAAAGRYEVLLLVTDDDGAADTRIHTADPRAPPPPEPNEPPQADFEVGCDGLTCTFEDKSKDDDGVIATWSWSFGDGATSSEQNPVHTYSTGDRQDVVLTVTDDRGATDTKTRQADPKD